MPTSHPSPAFAKWFGEKAQQITPDCLTAFGIELRSRYGQVAEMIDMIHFAQAAAERGLEGDLDCVSWDSKSCTGVIFARPGVTRGTATWESLESLVDDLFNQESECAELREARDE